MSPGWRRRGALRGRVMDVRLSGVRLRSALHDLAVFADATLANAAEAQDKGIFQFSYYIYIVNIIYTYADAFIPLGRHRRSWFSPPFLMPARQVGLIG